MKTQTLLITLLLSFITFSNAQEKLNIDKTKSEIKWFGEYTFYFGGHNGTINFKDGHFIKSNEVITGGEFIIDMTSIACSDIDTKDANESLVNHLKDPDFFDVSKFETSKLSIKRVEYHNANSMKIYAELTIKGITLPIDFQANVNYTNKEMTTRFKIDRQRWGIDYNSKLRDGAISDAIGFEVKLSL